MGLFKAKTRECEQKNGGAASSKKRAKRSEAEGEGVRAERTGGVGREKCKRGYWAKRG